MLLPNTCEKSRTVKGRVFCRPALVLGLDARHVVVDAVTSLWSVPCLKHSQGMALNWHIRDTQDLLGRLLPDNKLVEVLNELVVYGW